MALRGGKKGSPRSAARKSNSSSKVRSGGSFGGSGSANKPRPSSSTTRSRPAAKPAGSKSRTRGGTSGRTSQQRSSPGTTRPTAGSATQSPLRQRARGGTSSTTTSSSASTTSLRGTASGRTRTTKRTTGTTAGATTAASLQQQISSLQSRFSRLQASTDLGSAAQNIGQLDARLAELPLELEALRSRGYVHAGLLEKEISTLEEQWQGLRPRAENNLRQERNRLQRQLATTGQLVNRLSPRNAATLTPATTALNNLQSQLNTSLNSVSTLYQPMLSQLNLVEQSVARFEQVLEIFDQSPGVRLRPTEAPLMAAEAEWERDGNDGPVGVLFLTDQRLLFEQNEEVAKGKLFGLFTTSSEQVQRLLIDVPIQSVERTEHQDRGGFLGMGKEEVLELILGAQAPVSRARFVLKNQDAADWAVWIKKTQTGEIDRDRSEEYQEQIAKAEARVAAFPANCPSCFAPLPPPQRGQNYVSCLYCGAVVSPAGDEAG